jgi:hypothetical protein
VQAAVARNAVAADLVQPGHIFPLQAVDGGVLMRAGHTEAGCDLAAMAGCSPASVICEVMNEDGTMARLPQLEVFAAEHNLKMITVADLVRYRMRKEMLVRRVVETDLPTVYGRFRAVAYENVINGDVHLAMVMGDVRTDDPVLVRVHTENVTCDMFGSLIDDTGFQLHTALEKIAASARGVTHSHPDHFGGAGRFRDNHGADIITHRSFTTWFDLASDDTAVDEDGVPVARTPVPFGREMPWRNDQTFSPPLRPFSTRPSRRSHARCPG